MFTGIIEELAQVTHLDEDGDSARLGISALRVTAGARLGDSIAVSGVCLTVLECTDAMFTADVMAETLRRSTLGRLKPGSMVNVERAMVAGGRFGGHIVSGHVDGVGQLVDRQHTPHWDVLTITLPPAISRYVVLKGSITVDGVSLTVTDVDDAAGTFAVSLIPTTLTLTTLGTCSIGAEVNLEVDTIGKYVHRLLSTSEPGEFPALAGVTVAPA
ncbi:MAG: riboflavin synthase [Actinomycetota bacterium]